MSLLTLPNELLLQIATYLCLENLYSFLRTNRRLVDLLTPLLIQKYGLQVLFWAAGRGIEPLIRILLDKGVDVEARSWPGTALHHAVDGGHEAVVRMLLERGAKVLGRDSLGMTPIQTAVDKGSVSMVRLLLDYGADPNTKSCFSLPTSVLKSAFIHSHWAIVELLLERGAVDNEPGPRRSGLGASSEARQPNYILSAKGKRWIYVS